MIMGFKRFHGWLKNGTLSREQWVKNSGILGEQWVSKGWTMGEYIEPSWTIHFPRDLLVGGLLQRFHLQHSLNHMWDDNSFRLVEFFCTGWNQRMKFTWATATSAQGHLKCWFLGGPLLAGEINHPNAFDHAYFEWNKRYRHYGWL